MGACTDWWSYGAHIMLSESQVEMELRLAFSTYRVARRKVNVFCSKILKKGNLSKGNATTHILLYKQIQ